MYPTASLAGLWSRQSRGFYHEGRFQTLDEVIQHYDRHPNLELSPLEGLGRAREVALGPPGPQMENRRGFSKQDNHSGRWRVLEPVGSRAALKIGKQEQMRELTAGSANGDLVLKPAWNTV
jgi:hypothetical protein